jgi:hypothetical protein
MDAVREMSQLGPQGQHCADLLDRARRLTFDDRKRLAAAYSVAHDVAWCAAYDAARGAHDAVWGVARGAAWDAAVALASRDLIGLFGFTQAHYDLLTGPWRRVIGPVHPDDKWRNE